MPREFSFRLIYIADKQSKTIHLRLILEQTFWITRPSWNWWQRQSYSYNQVLVTVVNSNVSYS